MSNGQIVQCIGAVVDVEFPRDSHAARSMTRFSTMPTGTLTAGLTLEVQQQLGDGIVRTIALGSSDGLRRGMKCQAPAPDLACRWVPATLGRIMDVLGRPIDEAGPIKPTKSAADPPHRAEVRRTVARPRNCSKPASR